MTLSRVKKRCGAVHMKGERLVDRQKIVFQLQQQVETPFSSCQVPVSLVWGVCYFFVFDIIYIKRNEYTDLLYLWFEVLLRKKHDVYTHWFHCRNFCTYVSYSLSKTIQCTVPCPPFFLAHSMGWPLSCMLLTKEKQTCASCCCSMEQMWIATNMSTDTQLWCLLACQVNHYRNTLVITNSLKVPSLKVAPCMCSE